MITKGDRTPEFKKKLSKILATRGFREIGLQESEITASPEYETVDIQVWFNPKEYRVVNADTGKTTNLKLKISFATGDDAMTPELAWETIKRFIDADLAGGIDGVELVPRS